MKNLFFILVALVFTTSNVNAAKFGDFALNNKSEIKSLNDSNLSANAFLQLEFIPHTNKFAGVYWLPDYVENNNGYGYGGRVNDSDAPSGETAQCSDYGLLSCTPPKIGVNKKPVIGTSLVCYTSCKCAATSNCTSEYSLTTPPANSTTASCQVIDSNSCAKTSTKYKITGCNDGYTVSGSSCAVRTCPSGFTAGLTKATCPNTTDTYTTDGKSGTQVCGKCTIACDTSIYNKTDSSCKSEHSGFSNWKADTSKMCGTNSSACICSPTGCLDYDKTTNTRGSCTYGYEPAACNNGCENKYKCKGCANKGTLNSCPNGYLCTLEECSGKYYKSGCANNYNNWCGAPETDCKILGYNVRPIDSCPGNAAFIECPFDPGGMRFCLTRLDNTYTCSKTEETVISCANGKRYCCPSAYVSCQYAVPTGSSSDKWLACKEANIN